MSYKLDKLYENLKIEKNEKQLFNILSYIYNEFGNVLECDPEKITLTFF